MHRWLLEISRGRMESRMTDQPQIPRGPMQGEESTGSNKKQFFSFLF